jgi:hypothetical protein
MKLVATYLIGLVFGVGISFSGMSDPAKVLNFFDVAGTWDPSLALVMGGALPALGSGRIEVFVFVAAMLAAMLATRAVLARPRGAAATPAK